MSSPPWLVALLSDWPRDDDDDDDDDEDVVLPIGIFDSSIPENFSIASSVHSP
jgi:hypothetical protein